MLKKESHHLFLCQILRHFGFYSFFLNPVGKELSAVLNGEEFQRLDFQINI